MTAQRCDLDTARAVAGLLYWAGFAEARLRAADLTACEPWTLEEIQWIRWTLYDSRPEAGRALARFILRYLPEVCDGATARERWRRFRVAASRDTGDAADWVALAYRLATEPDPLEVRLSGRFIRPRFGDRRCEAERERGWPCRQRGSGSARRRALRSGEHDRDHGFYRPENSEAEGYRPGDSGDGIARSFARTF